MTDTAEVVLVAYLREHGHSAKTRQLYVQAVRRARVYFTGRGRTLEEVTLEELREFCQTVPATRSSQARIRYALMAYYRAIGREDGAPAVRLANLPAPYRLPRPVSRAGYAELVAAARRLGGVHQVLGELLATTACRIGEAQRARWDQFDFTTKPAVWYIEGKGAHRRGPKVRQVPLHPALVETLRAWRDVVVPTGFVFASIRSGQRRVNVSTLSRWVAQIGEEAGVDGATPHRWRHTVATLALEDSRDIRAVQELLGHSSLQSTQVYTGVIAGRLQSLVGSLPVDGHD